MTSPFAEIALLLLIAAGVGALFVRLRQPVLIAYIVVGVAVGPAGFGVVQAHDQIDLLAQIGVAVLLFVVGLKLDLHHVRHIGPVALATGLGQLAFKQRAHESYGRVLVAVDFSEWSAPLLDLARGVAPGAHQVLLSAYEVPFEGKLRFASVAEATIDKFRVQAQQAATDQLHALAARAGLKPADWTPCKPYADASLAIVEQEQELDCDLIVIGKHGQNMAEELLLGSVTKHVLTESAGDVLVSTSRQA